jgi:hypothetical protein
VRSRSHSADSRSTDPAIGDVSEPRSQVPPRWPRRDATSSTRRNERQPASAPIHDHHGSQPSDHRYDRAPRTR